MRKGGNNRKRIRRLFAPLRRQVVLCARGLPDTVLRLIERYTYSGVGNVSPIHITIK